MLWWLAVAGTRSGKNRTPMPPRVALLILFSTASKRQSHTSKLPVIVCEYSGLLADLVLLVSLADLAPHNRKKKQTTVCGAWIRLFNKGEIPCLCISAQM